MDVDDEQTQRDCAARRADTAPGSGPERSARRDYLTAACAGAAGAVLPGTCGRKHSPLEANDIGHLSMATLGQRAQPASVASLRDLLQRWPGQVCVAGGRYSMGGQTMRAGALQLDMTQLTRPVWLNVEQRCVRVQAGMRWRELQQWLDPHELSVKVMQSYSNFSIGGSVSVNCHGRHIGTGPLASSIRALQLVDAQGRVHELDRQHQPDLFAAVIGGYGGLGAVTEVELDLDRNTRIARRGKRVALSDDPAWFSEHVLSDPDAASSQALRNRQSSTDPALAARDRRRAG